MVWKCRENGRRKDCQANILWRLYGWIKKSGKPQKAKHTSQTLELGIMPRVKTITEDV